VTPCALGRDCESSRCDLDCARDPRGFGRTRYELREGRRARGSRTQHRRSSTGAESAHRGVRCDETAARSRRRHAASSQRVSQVRAPGRPPDLLRDASRILRRPRDHLSSRVVRQRRCGHLDPNFGRGRATVLRQAERRRPRARDRDGRIDLALAASTRPRVRTLRQGDGWSTYRADAVETRFFDDRKLPSVLAELVGLLKSRLEAENGPGKAR